MQFREGEIAHLTRRTLWRADELPGVEPEEREKITPSPTSAWSRGERQLIGQTLSGLIATSPIWIERLWEESKKPRTSARNFEFGRPAKGPDLATQGRAINDERKRNKSHEKPNPRFTSNAGAFRTPSTGSFPVNRTSSREPIPVKVKSAFERARESIAESSRLAHHSLADGRSPF